MESQTELRFARFASIKRDDPAIEQHRQDFAREVIALAESSSSRGSFERRLADELLAAGMPVPAIVGNGKVFLVYNIGMGCVLKMQASLHDMDRHSTITEVRFWQQYPKLFATIYGWHVHKADKLVETNWAFSIVKRVLPFDKFEKHFMRPLVSDSMKFVHWGIEYGTGRLVLIDAGGANTDLPTLEMPF